jgi:hypothetical protein
VVSSLSDSGYLNNTCFTGHYCACLEDKPFDETLSVDAQTCGNEMRFINAFQGIGEKANVKMRTAYINTVPHILILCTEDIEIGEELLLDYGEEYTKTYMSARPEPAHPSVAIRWRELPGRDDNDEDSEEEQE